MDKTHHYNLSVKWTGNTGQGTKDYKSYDRSHLILADNKATIAGSSDPAFRGDTTRYNPEELFVASLSTCHMLWYLHLCSEAGIIVTDYIDNATGTMTETSNGGGQFTAVILHPVVTVTHETMLAKAAELHHAANELCYIANSCNFPIQHQPVFFVKAM
ncbi:MAG: OsmC family protein [Ferruginibacter sp.]|nr:OsmC family protein [Ferruginibacter sp.]